MLVMVKIVAFALFGGLSWYLLGRFGRIGAEFFKNPPGKRVLLLLRLGLTLLLGLLCTRVSNGVILALLHLLVFGGIWDGISRILRRFFSFPRNRWYRLIAQGLVPVALTAGLFVYGADNMAQIRETRYTLTTQKPIRQEGWRIAFLSDIHYGTIQDEALVETYVEQINALAPDIIVLGGDIVEEGTTPEAMREVFAKLGKLRATYGVYFVYGNHDRHMAPVANSYSEAELAAAIEENGIIILQDETLLLEGELYLIGREDASRSRVGISALAQDAPENAYVISLDHQPKNPEASAVAGVDLTLSGHTHGGQIFPAGYVLELFGGMPYGLYQTGSHSAIVSSGFAGWGFPIRTQGHCEYVIVDILPQ